MSAPQKPVSARVSALPAPELVSLVQADEDPSAGAIEPWWEEYGGTRDEVSGVIAFPPRSLPPCPFPCTLCDRRRKGA